MTQKYMVLTELLELIEEPNQEICRRVQNENAELFELAPGSGHNHQFWNGGYTDHITETMNIAVQLYGVFDSMRPLPFSLSDSLLVLYLHDFERPWRYIKKEGEWTLHPDLADQENQAVPFAQSKIEEYGFILDDQIQIALKYIEGEKKDYSPKKRSQTPLAAFAHICDTWSARGWFDFPSETNDPWDGAKRSL
jgi:hypothetical protein